jgi:O-antigen ligase
MAQLATSRPEFSLGRRRMLTLFLLACIVPVGALITRFPILGLALGGAPLLAWFAWPRWIHRDIEYFAGAVFVESSLLGLLSLVDFGGYTLGGVITIVAVIVAVLLLAHNSGHVDVSVSWLWPFLAFLAWSYISFLRVPVLSASHGLQNIVVFTAFIAMTIVAATRSRAERDLPRRIELLFERAYWLLAALGVASIAVRGPGGGFILSAQVAGSSRSFALLALLGVASGLCRWRYGERKRGAAITVSAILLIALSLSRTAFVVACVLVPLAWFKPKSIGAFVRVALVVAGVSGIVWAAITFVEPIHQRFFPTTGDFVDVGGYQVNTNGRSQLWPATWSQFEQSPWLGNGAGAAEVLTTSLGVGHPHNDYLRLLDDYGLIGTGLWAVGVFLIVGRLIRVWIRADTAGDPEARLYLWALLGMVALLLTMITDNVLVYLHVQGPLAIIVGMALGRADLNRNNAHSRIHGMRNHASWSPEIATGTQGSSD